MDTSAFGTWQKSSATSQTVCCLSQGAADTVGLKRTWSGRL